MRQHHQCVAVVSPGNARSRRPGIGRYPNAARAIFISNEGAEAKGDANEPDAGESGRGNMFSIRFQNGSWPVARSTYSKQELFRPHDLDRNGDVDLAELIFGPN